MSEEKSRPTEPGQYAARAPDAAKHREPSTGSDAHGGGGQTVAVALDYDPKAATSAPTILATGRGAVAEQILELAFAHGVKVRQDADLVQILSAVDVDSEIPVEAFAAVAEILAYVYRANGLDADEWDLSEGGTRTFAATMADRDPGPPAPPVTGRSRLMTAPPPPTGEAPPPPTSASDEETSR